MARGTMHAPKPEGQRRRTNTPTHGENVVTDDGALRGPALSGDFSPETKAWHETWRRSPQAALFEATDWGRLALLAPIVDSYFRRPSAAALSEIRLNEERLGATVVDRMRARIRIEREAAPTEGEEPSADGVVVPFSSSRQALADRMRPSP